MKKKKCAYRRDLKLQRMLILIAYEAKSRIFSFDIDHQKLSVQKLTLHLPEKQSVVFDERDDPKNVASKIFDGDTMFTRG